MKYLKTLPIIILLLCLNQTVEAQSETYFKENMAITDLAAVKNTNGTFYYQLKLKNYGKRKVLPEGFGMKGQVFMDNGQFNDAVAGDGIYTSMEHLDAGLLKSRPITKTTFYDVDFQHIGSLSGTGGTTINQGVGCKFRQCGCPCSSYPCPACTIFGWSCWEPYDCEISIGME